MHAGTALMGTQAWWADVIATAVGIALGGIVTVVVFFLGAWAGRRDREAQRRTEIAREAATLLERSTAQWRRQKRRWTRQLKDGDKSPVARLPGQSDPPGLELLEEASVKLIALGPSSAAVRSALEAIETDASQRWLLMRIHLYASHIGIGLDRMTARMDALISQSHSEMDAEVDEEIKAEMTSTPGRVAPEDTHRKLERTVDMWLIAVLKRVMDHDYTAIDELSGRLTAWDGHRTKDLTEISDLGRLGGDIGFGKTARDAHLTEWMSWADHKVAELTAGRPPSDVDD